MSRGFRSAVVAIGLVTVLLLGIVSVTGFSFMPGIAHAQPSTPTTPTAQNTPSPKHALPPQLAFLSQMTPTQRFDHFVSAQATFTNPQGQNVVLNAVPGKLTAVSAKSVTIQPNGTSSTRTFSITSDTWIVPRPTKGSIRALNPGDRAVVLYIDNSTDAAAVVEPRAMQSTMSSMTGDSFTNTVPVRLTAKH